MPALPYFFMPPLNRTMPARMIDPTRIPVLHPYTAPPPVAIIVEPAAYAEPNAKGHKFSRIRAPHPQNLWIIAWHVDDIGLRWNDANFLVLSDDFLLGRVG